MSASRKDTVGFIGMGMMGGGMAANLLKKGFAVVGHDVNPARNKLLQGKGAVIADGPAAVARAAAKVICMVETTAQAEAVILGPNGIAEGAEKGNIVLCMSTIDPLAVKRMHATLAQRGIGMIDAPVSGGVPRANSGDLSAIVGGDSATVEACRPVLAAMASNIFHMGGIGQGLAMKLCNNMLGHIATIAAAEAMVLGAKAGLDPKMMFDVISASTGNSVTFQSRVPRYLSGDFSPGGTMEISYKDQDLVTTFAKALGVPMFLANVTQQVYQMARAAGFNKEDGAATVKLYERMTGVKLGPRE
jgi:3-hydroxyisobutyrate dehydrogenase-like beta-hydroxyacid dehydrogenase